MASKTADDRFIKLNVKLSNGKQASVAVSQELYGHFTSTDPVLQKMAKQLILQAAMEQAATEDVVESSESPPEPVPVPPNSPSSSRKNEPFSGIFTKEQTLFIISGYKDRKEKFLSPVFKKRILWNEITEDLNKEFQTSFSPSQVEGRWKTKVASYKRHKADQNKSGNERKEFPFEDELEDILGERHDVNPLFVAGSMVSSDEPQSSTSSEIGSLSPKPKKRKKNDSNSSQVLKFLEKYTDNQNKNNAENIAKIEQMHKEKMEIFSGVLAVLKSLKE